MNQAIFVMVVSLPWISAALQEPSPAWNVRKWMEAIRKSYRENRNKDSLVLIAVKQCRKKFQQQGIDMSAYNSEQSVEDINDLRLALKLDSLTLVGISYSGGLMPATANKHPEAVRALVLNSPLPIFTNYEEESLLNFQEALDQVFEN